MFVIHRGKSFWDLPYFKDNNIKFVALCEFDLKTEMTL